jgi:hypothetical protein
MSKRFWWERQKERDMYEDLDIGGMVILTRIIKKCSYDGRYALDSSGLGQRSVADSVNNVIYFALPQNVQNISCV